MSLPPLDARPLDRVTTLAFDIFGTVLDLTGSMTAPCAELLGSKGASISADTFWDQWRARQRVEQYQDSLLDRGHSGYLETCRRALVYCLRHNGIAYTDAEVRQTMDAWRHLVPHPDVAEGLRRMKARYRIVALSNGEQSYLAHLVRHRMPYGWDAVISVQQAGYFKPHPSVYRTAAMVLGEEPERIMMVAAHAFDVMGARACGYRGAYVNRYRLPYEDSAFQPDLEVSDFVALAKVLSA